MPSMSSKLNYMHLYGAMQHCNLRSSYDLYAKRSGDDPWTSNDSNGLKLRKSVEKRCRNAFPVRSMTKKAPVVLSAKGMAPPFVDIDLSEQLDWPPWQLIITESSFHVCKRMNKISNILMNTVFWDLMPYTLSCQYLAHLIRLWKWRMKRPIFWDTTVWSPLKKSSDVAKEHVTSKHGSSCLMPVSCWFPWLTHQPWRWKWNVSKTSAFHGIISQMT
jgi:hypothetical protein